MRALRLVRYRLSMVVCDVFGRPLTPKRGGGAPAVGVASVDEADEDEEMGDGDDESDLDNSRSATPDMSKLTRRQRGAFEEDANLMALSNEAQTKKQLSAEEHAMRRQEMARRRKNLSEKRNEEEKVCSVFRHLFRSHDMAC